MKAIAVNTYVVDVGSFRPVVVEILTDEGISGVGEGAVGFGIGCNAAAAMIKELAERFVVGKDIGGILSIWNDWSRRSGTSRVRRSACRSMSCWEASSARLFRFTQTDGRRASAFARRTLPSARRQWPSRAFLP